MSTPESFTDVNFQKVLNYKKRLVQNCKQECKAAGSKALPDFYPEDCSCHKKYLARNRMIVSNIPANYAAIHTEEIPQEKLIMEFDVEQDRFVHKYHLFKDKISPYLNNLDHVYANGASLFFVGHNESGKTHTATYILGYVLEQGYSGYYINLQELYDLYNKTRLKASELQNARLYWDILSADFVVVDEVGKESTTDPLRQFFEFFLKERTNNSRPTILIGNFDLVKCGKKVFIDRFGNSCWSALVQNFFFFQFSSKGNFRHKNRLDWSYS